MPSNQSAKYPNVLQSFGILGIIFLFQILSALPNVLHMHGLEMDKEVSIFINYFVSFGLSTLVIYWLGKRKNKTTGLQNISFKYFDLVPLLVVIILALQLGITTPLVNIIPMPEFVIEYIKSLYELKGIYMMLTLVVLAPIFEEGIFRGIMLDGLLKKYSPQKAILISSLLFGIMHLNPWQFIGAFVFGCFAGWVYYRTSNLSLTIAIHFFNNLTALLSMLWYDDIDFMLREPITSTYGSIQNYVMVTLVALVIAFLSLRYLKNILDRSASIETAPAIESE